MKPIHKMTIEEKNREVAEWLGIIWHEVDNNKRFACSCGWNTISINHLFTHLPRHKIDFHADAGPIQLLREMMKEGK